MLRSNLIRDITSSPAFRVLESIESPTRDLSLKVTTRTTHNLAEGSRGKSGSYIAAGPNIQVCDAESKAHTLPGSDYRISRRLSEA